MMDRFFGVVCPWEGVQTLGVTTIRCGGGATQLGDWPGIQPQRGAWRWQPADEEMDLYQRLSIDPLPILSYSPLWATSVPGVHNAPPAEPLDYARFAEAFVSRYRGRVKQVELWNEQNDDAFCRGSLTQYVDLLCAGSAGARRADPSIKVVYGGTAGVALRYIDETYAYGIQDAFDIMSVHPYQWAERFQDQWFVDQIAGLRRLMNRYGDAHKPIWLTELGWSTGDASITEAVQARLLTQCLVTARTLQPLGVTRAYWFSIKDWGGPGYGLLRVDGSRKPAWHAYRVLIRWLADSRYMGRVHTSPEGRCHLFERPSGASVAVLWADEPVELTLTAQPEAIWDYMGRRITGWRPLDDRQIRVTAVADPVFIPGVRDVIMSSPGRVWRANGPMRTARRLPTWISIPAPTHTQRLNINRCLDTAALRLVIRSLVPIPRARLRAVLPGYRGAWHAVSIPDASPVTLDYPVQVPPSVQSGVVTGYVELCAGRDAVRTQFPIRISDGEVIEFTGNSPLEISYLYRNEHSGGAPSVRFNGVWVYRFDLGRARTASLRLNVGAHQAGPWRVSASADDTDYATVLSGRSERAWHTADMSRWAGGTLYLRFDGDDQQLEELILTWR